MLGLVSHDAHSVESNDALPRPLPLTVLCVLTWCHETKSGGSDSHCAWYTKRSVSAQCWSCTAPTRLSQTTHPLPLTVVCVCVCVCTGCGGAGSPTDATWPLASKLKYFHMFKPERPFKRRVRDEFSHNRFPNVTPEVRPSLPHTLMALMRIGRIAMRGGR